MAGLNDAERAQLDLDDLELVHLVGGHPNRIVLLRPGCGRPAPAEIGGRTPAAAARAARARPAEQPCARSTAAGGRCRSARCSVRVTIRCFMTSRCSSPAASSCASHLFHQPPPSAWNRATVSAETCGFGLYARKRRLQIGLLRVEQDRQADLALLDLPAHKIEAARRRPAPPQWPRRGRGQSACSARSVSATFWKAISTVLRYWATDCTRPPRQPAACI